MDNIKTQLEDVAKLIASQPVVTPVAVTVAAPAITPVQVPAVEEEKETVIAAVVTEKVTVVAAGKLSEGSSDYIIVEKVSAESVQSTPVSTAVAVSSVTSVPTSSTVPTSSATATVPIPAPTPSPSQILLQSEELLRKLLKVLHVCSRYQETVGKPLPASIDFFGKTLLGKTSIRYGSQLNQT